MAIGSRRERGQQPGLRASGEHQRRHRPNERVPNLLRRAQVRRIATQGTPTGRIHAPRHDHRTGHAQPEHIQPAQVSQLQFTPMYTPDCRQVYRTYRAAH